jgi:hypothetical protein
VPKPASRAEKKIGKTSTQAQTYSPNFWRGRSSLNL